MHISDIEVELKSFKTKLSGLKPVVLIIGDNGSGKTALLNGAQLALVGTAYDVAGRNDVSAKYAVEELLPKGGARVKLTLSDGSEVYGIDGKSAPPVRLLYQEAEEALVGSLADARAFSWLFRTFVSEEHLSSVPAPTSDEPGIKDQFRKINEGLKQAEIKTRKDRLLRICAEAKNAAKRTKDEAKTLETALDVLCAYADAPGAMVYDAIETLTQFQYEGGYSKCGVCGAEDISRDTFVARHEHAKAKRGENAVPVPGVLLKDINSRKSTALSTSADLTKVADFAEAWVTAAVVTRLEYIEAAVNRFMPEGMRVSFKSEPRFRFMLTRYGTPAQSATSGAETVLVLMAIAAAAAEENTTGLNFLIPPDRFYDYNTLDWLLEIGRKANGSTWIQSGYATETVAADVSCVLCDGGARVMVAGGNE